jgi:hypothetical protein
MPRYENVSGVVFALIALAQLVRAILRLPVQVGSLMIPVWFSFLAAGISGGLAIWALQSRSRSARQR